MSEKETLNETNEKKALVVGGLNVTVRLKNKTFLLALVAAVVGLVYTVLGMFDFMPSITESEIMTIAEAILGVLVLVGVIQDPTTSGVSDSERAKTYVEPKK